MFSKSSEYAIRAAIYIAAEGTRDKMVGIGEICDHIVAPKHFTAKILQVLTKTRIISSKAGVNGGFYLDNTQPAISLIEIVKAVDGDGLFRGCGLGLKECSEKEPCPIHHQFKPIRNAIIKMMEKATIAEMATELKKGGGFLRKN
ncbi:Rrf2 family transcriptional regulator [Mucilaginibacter sp. HC2]|uniref:RrF2 family transcriptional regulator n=1 Tax=Mucilaginibacter inviolabilis TaxID=2714892 RepID=UPI00140CE0A1|nr:Rrf2 family transcriptional regulator [Mucilaginibacter inviolabilis]NHA02578.1 Rrf2 family transcriptional regulator [Mucilaginibacter inviolabilis]